MNSPIFVLKAICAAVFALTLAGCGTEPTAPAPSAEAADEHVHASSGPHGGDILELGEYHAELVHDDAAGTVSVYVLDGAAAENVPVDAAEATINLTHDGQAEQFKLAASPMEGEPEGWSSRFVTLEAGLGEELDHAENARFVVTINGQQHRAAIEHHHEEGEGDAHDHAHE